MTSKARHAEIKDIVYEGYGGYRCKCCGTARKEVLTLDHINNDGAADRKEKLIGTKLYRHLINNNFPNHIRVLCMNCQIGRKRSPDGKCPCENKPYVYVG